MAVPLQPVHFALQGFDGWIELLAQVFEQDFQLCCLHAALLLYVGHVSGRHYFRKKCSTLTLPKDFRQQRSCHDANIELGTY